MDVNGDGLPLFCPSCLVDLILSLSTDRGLGIDVMELHKLPLFLLAYLRLTPYSTRRLIYGA